jgi:hypothetical protein
VARTEHGRRSRSENSEAEGIGGGAGEERRISFAYPGERVKFTRRADRDWRWIEAKMEESTESGAPVGDDDGAQGQRHREWESMKSGGASIREAPFGKQPDGPPKESFASRRPVTWIGLLSRGGLREIMSVALSSQDLPAVV